MLEDGARDDLAEVLAGQAEPGDQPVQRGGEHVLVRSGGILPVRPGERDTVTAQDGDAAHGRHDDPPHIDKDLATDR
ncbi:hypothetical protein L3i22_078400 [Actinoplanes sp. L3-i22]|nr:hypothetical protein L3i22_078400 [Actinoplanes sp. L3-i22]